ncbi:MAG TPA: GMC oxidoreductase [Stellaceae bacterium]|nr:GMC oxidoreductase [Stellaceae bacterium]
MILDARTVPSGTVIESDLCIIGAGSSGISLALQFAGTGLKVCQVESGGLEPDRELQALADGDSIGVRYSSLASCQQRCFGGNGNVWGGWFTPLDAIDFTARSWVEDSGWPFGAAELARHSRRVHDLCEVPEDDYDIGAVAKLGDPAARLLPFDRTLIDSVLYRFSPPTRFGQKYRAEIAAAHNITCYTHAHALSLKARWNAREIDRVELGTLAGTRFAVRARQFVLATGAIENARLLLLSNDVATSGLGNEHDLVGRYFQDHPHTKRALVTGPAKFPLGLYGLAFRGRGLAAGLALPPRLQEAERLLNYKASIYPVFYGEDSAGWAAFRTLALSLSRRWGSDLYDRFALPFRPRGVRARDVAVMILAPHKTAAAALSHAFHLDRFRVGYVLESKPEQAPNRDSRILLYDQRDPFGLPRARIDWRLRPIDRRTVVRAEELIDGELRRLGLGRLAPLGPGETESWPKEFAGGWHQIGTTRAHRDPRHGVVDADCRLHGVANLHIAGASVFPTGGAVSPTPTIVAMTLRLAEHLRRTLMATEPLVAGAA